MADNQKYCPSCGSSNPPEVVFCMTCGKKFPQELPQPVPMYERFSAPQSSPPIPQPARSDFITLSCPNCGGRLLITPDIERFACQFCGYEHIVRRSGGMVSLEPVVRMMGQINGNINMVGMGVNRLGFTSEKQVAEQAIVRLKEEIPQLETKLASLSPKLTSGGQTFGFVLLGLGGTVLFILILVSIGDYVSGFLWFLSILAIIMGIIFAATNKGKPNPDYLQAKLELTNKKTELDRNYEIVRRF